MQIDENSLYIEAIKLVAGSVQYKNLSVQDTFMDAVSQLYQYYQNSQNIKYLETAILHIQAYLEMGFPYEQGKTVFDVIRCHAIQKVGIFITITIGEVKVIFIQYFCFINLIP